jgi:hypothetical protein
MMVTHFKCNVLLHSPVLGHRVRCIDVTNHHPPPPQTWGPLAILIDPSPLYKLFFVDPERRRKLSKKALPKTHFRKWLESTAQTSADNISQDYILAYFLLQIWRSSFEFWKWNFFVLSSFIWTRVYWLIWRPVDMRAVQIWPRIFFVPRFLH